MNGLSSIGISSGPPAAAVMRLSPQRPGMEGLVRSPAGQAVPIGSLLGRVLARYGVLLPLDQRQPPAEARSETGTDLFA